MSKTSIEFHPLAENSSLRVPLLDEKVHAGFPLPVDPVFQNAPIDLNRVLMEHPAATFIGRVVGDSMVEEGIDDGDLVVIDKSITPTESHICIVEIEREFAVKRLLREGGVYWLLPGNPKYRPIRVTPEMELHVWGVVTWVLKQK